MPGQETLQARRQFWAWTKLLGLGLLNLNLMGFKIELLKVGPNCSIDGLASASNELTQKMHGLIGGLLGSWAELGCSCGLQMSQLLGFWAEEAKLHMGFKWPLGGLHKKAQRWAEG